MHYGNKYINKRDFMDLSKVNMNSAIDAKIFDKKLNGLQWITPLYPDNPKKEISSLLKAIDSTAPAVYSPTPGKLINSSKLLGTFPL